MDVEAYQDTKTNQREVAAQRRPRCCGIYCVFVVVQELAVSAQLTVTCRGRHREGVGKDPSGSEAEISCEDIRNVRGVLRTPYWDELGGCGSWCCWTRNTLPIGPRAC